MSCYVLYLKTDILRNRARNKIPFLHTLGYKSVIEITFSLSANICTGTSIEREQADRWVEYFCDVLNHPQPDELADTPPVPDDLNIDTQQKQKLKMPSKL